jgi:hypothetical protein
MRDVVVSFVVGLLFAAGLGIAGMTNPAKVIGFLDFFGHWDPTLAFVMVGGIGAYALAFPLITKRKAPLLGGKFSLPTRKDLTPQLLVGSGLFGIGWGIGGLCPGPGLASLATGALPVLSFVVSMLAGMALYKHVLEKRLT